MFKTRIIPHGQEVSADPVKKHGILYKFAVYLLHGTKTIVLFPLSCCRSCIDLVRGRRVSSPVGEIEPSSSKYSADSLMTDDEMTPSQLGGVSWAGLPSYASPAQLPKSARGRCCHSMMCWQDLRP